MDFLFFSITKDNDDTVAIRNLIFPLGILCFSCNCLAWKNWYADYAESTDFAEHPFKKT
jgi:hypothetical protein